MGVNSKLAPLLSLLLFLTGCAGYGPWARQVAEFSANVAPPLVRASTAYTSANEIHTLQEESVLVGHYAQGGYHPGELVPFISEKDVQPRIEAIAALKEYIDLIDALATDQRAVEVEAKTKSLSITTAAARTEMASNATTNTNTTTSSNAVKVNPTLTDTTTQTTTSTSTLTNSHSVIMTPQQVNSIMSGMDSALKPFIHHMVKKRLPNLMKEADPIVQDLCSLLEADLDTLRVQSQGDYRVLLMQQSEFIHNNPNLDPVEKRAEILKLFQIEAAADKSQSDLNDTIDGLKRLATEHHKIVTEDTNHDAK
jgi:hypothetical protein